MEGKIFSGWVLPFLNKPAAFRLITLKNKISKLKILNLKKYPWLVAQQQKITSAGCAGKKGVRVSGTGKLSWCRRLAERI